MYNVLYITDVYVLYYYIRLVSSPAQIPQFVTFAQKLLYLLILSNNFMRCNSHTITFILSNNLVFLLYSQSCATTTTTNFMFFGHAAWLAGS